MRVQMRRADPERATAWPKIKAEASDTSSGDRSTLETPRIDTCYVSGYTHSVIRHFKHRGLKRFFAEGTVRGIQPEHAERLRLILARLHASFQPADMDLPGLGLHPLKGKLRGHWAVKVSGNWRVTFRFETQQVVDVDYVDYH